jgi:antitoxin ParD1/3/4
MVTMNISLPERLKKRVLLRVAQGDFANASDYVRDLIRKDMEARAKLNAELRKGELSGVGSRRIPEILSAAKRARARSG